MKLPYFIRKHLRLQRRMNYVAKEYRKELEKGPFGKRAMDEYREEMKREC